MKYRVRAIATISLSTVVEADSEEQALAMADDRPMCTLSDPGFHGDHVDQVWVHSGEIDGTPCDLEIVEEESQ